MLGRPLVGGQACCKHRRVNGDGPSRFRPVFSKTENNQSSGVTSAFRTETGDWLMAGEAE